MQPADPEGGGAVIMTSGIAIGAVGIAIEAAVAGVSGVAAATAPTAAAGATAFAPPRICGGSTG